LWVDRLGLRIADRLGQHFEQLSLGLHFIAHRSPPVTNETTVGGNGAPQENPLIKLAD
jgi:hypothetical protein